MRLFASNQCIKWCLKSQRQTPVIHETLMTIVPRGNNIILTKTRAKLLLL